MTAKTDGPQTAEAETLREVVERAVLYTADRTWGIAYRGKAPDEVALAIEALSDDPVVCAEIVAEIMAGKRGE
jgi:hypothetical protein